MDFKPNNSTMTADHGVSEKTKRIDDEVNDLTRKLDTKEISPQDLVPDKSFKDYLTISFLCLLIAFGGFVFGYDTGTIPGFVVMPDFVRRFGEISGDIYYLSNVRTGLIISIFHIGCALGGIFICKTADYYGRRIGLMISMAIYIVGVVIQITAVDKWYQIFVGRFFTGLSIGTTMVIAPMMISECSPKKVRGTLVCLFQLCITFGIFIGNCTTYGTKKYTDSRLWRVPLGLGFAWALVLVAALITMPESPRYLVEKGQIEAAKRAIARANNANVEDLEVIAEVNMILTGIEKEKQAGNASWKELITGKPRIFERLVIGVVLQALQQLTGTNYFFYYGTTIFKAVGLEDAFLTAIILSLVNFASTFVGVYAIDKLGRRLSLLWGSIGMLICFVIYSSLGSTRLYVSGYDGVTNIPTGNTMIVFSCLFLFCFASTWAGAVLCIVSETYPLRIRSIGMSIALSANWLTNFLISFCTPFITAKIHFYYGFVFSGCLFFSIFYVYFFVNETKGLTLEEVDELYMLGVKPWKSSKWVPAERSSL